MKEAEAKVFHLHQTIKSLTIQLDEEKEARVDLEIEIIKLRKDVTKLKNSMEMLNNNYYDAEDQNLREVSIVHHHVRGKRHHHSWWRQQPQPPRV